LAADGRAGQGRLSRPRVRGRGHGVGFEQAALGRRYAVKFDAPINVSKSALMTIMRQSVRALIAPDGASIDDKGKPNGIMTLARI
jgi:hypothetical protein